jgi:SAM-dependent methyltransferase
MPDKIFEHPRLAAIYHALDPDRSDLDVYVAIADELGARRVLDVGCGTGTLALLLAERGPNVIGVDPAGASLSVARAKPGAERVRWIHGDAMAFSPLAVDLATMTGNVAQAIADESDWEATLQCARGVAPRRAPRLRDTRPRVRGVAGVDPRDSSTGPAESSSFSRGASRSARSTPERARPPRSRPPRRGRAARHLRAERTNPCS